jgi:hypothetical protein
MSSPSSQARKSNWPRDSFGRAEVSTWFWWVGFPLVAAVAAIVAVVALGLLPTGRLSVVIYAAQDQVYAEPILQQFTKETGIKVRAVYDSSRPSRSFARPTAGQPSAFAAAASPCARPPIPARLRRCGS